VLYRERSILSDLLLIDGDVAVVGNDLALTTGSEAVQQHLSQRLKTFLSEWFLDKRIGIAYLEQILIKNPDPVVVDSILKKEIVTTPGILELTQFILDFDPSSREMTLTFSARTSDGVINFSEVIP